MTEVNAKHVRVYVASTQISDIGTIKSAIGGHVQSVGTISTNSREKFVQTLSHPGALIFVDFSSNHEKLGWICELAGQHSLGATVVVVDRGPEPSHVQKAFKYPIDDFINLSEDPSAIKPRLLSRVRDCACKVRLHSQIKTLEQQIDIDDLSGLFNMRSVYRRIEGEIRRALRYKRDLSCVMMDIDHFKRVNDLNDHLFGSFCLSEVGKLISTTIRTGMDVAARYGGDEFLVVLPETGYEGAAGFSERFRNAFANHHFDNHVSQMKLTVSVGYTSFEIQETVSAEDLVRRADKALYLAKARGRNRCEGLTRISASLSANNVRMVSGN